MKKNAPNFISRQFLKWQNQTRKTEKIRGFSTKLEKFEFLEKVGNLRFFQSVCPAPPQDGGQQVGEGPPDDDVDDDDDDKEDDDDEDDDEEDGNDLLNWI